ncbi:hypothetical protein ACFV7Q_29900 [Streptomyces sp. NPDC059851]|uniref:hypothetical protein n=1 Tax=Streptomyces sp. NPDC059851 TaxID=3346971 RepID=UPI00364C9A18
MGGIDGAGSCGTEEVTYGTDFFRASDMRSFLRGRASPDADERRKRPMMIGRDFGVQTDQVCEKKLLEAGLLYLYCVPGYEPPEEGHTVVRLQEGCVATDYPPPAM